MSNQSRSSLSNPVPQFRWWTIALIAALALLTALFVTVCAQAKTLNYFADLKAGNGRELYASVVQGRDGNFMAPVRVESTEVAENLPRMETWGIPAHR